MDMSFMAKFAGQRAGRGRPARPRLGRRGRRRRGCHHLHAVAQRGRPDRGRPDRHQARPRAASSSSSPTPRTATRSTGCGKAAERLDADVTITDVTPDLAQLNLQGPRSRDVLSAPDRRPTCRPRPTRSAPRARSRSPASRSSARGSPTSASWATSSTCPPAPRSTVYDALLRAGAAHGIRPVGLKSLASLRMEKGYRDFGHDIDNTDDPVSVGLGFALGWTSPALRRARRRAGAQGGRAAVEAAGADPAARPRAAALPRRAGAPRRRGRRLRPRGVVRLDARRRPSAWPS